MDELELDYKKAQIKNEYENKIYQTNIIVKGQEHSFKGGQGLIASLQALLLVCNHNGGPVTIKDADDNLIELSCQELETLITDLSVYGVQCWVEKEAKLRQLDLDNENNSL